MGNDTNRSKPKRVYQRCQIIRMKTCRVVFPIANPGIRIMVTPAVGNDMIASGKGLHLRTPGTIIVEASMDKYDRRSLAMLYIIELSAVCYNFFYVQSPFLQEAGIRRLSFYQK